MTRWLQLTIHVSSPTDAEKVSDCLNELEAQAITFQDAEDNPLYEPEINTTPLWNTVLVKGLFIDNTNMEMILNQLQQQLSDIKWHYTLQEINETDWQDSWKENFKPLCFGGRLWIVPSWHDAPDPHGINLQLDPGLGFGTGSHPTTQACLEWLATHDVKNKMIIDYGCGSGILALAAIKLGAKKVLAIDIDPQALEATRDNAQRNAISESQLLTLYPEQCEKITVDIVVANILAKPLIELAPIFGGLCKAGGTLILTGILAEQAQEVIDAYKSNFKIKNKVTAGEWILLEFMHGNKFMHRKI